MVSLRGSSLNRAAVLPPLGRVAEGARAISTFKIAGSSKVTQILAHERSSYFRRRDGRRGARTGRMRARARAVRRLRTVWPGCSATLRHGRAAHRDAAHHRTPSRAARGVAVALPRRRGA